MIYQSGLLLGNFSPLHKGHLQLIQTALTKSQNISILLFTSKQEIIPFEIRKQWLLKAFPTNITIFPFVISLEMEAQELLLIQKLKNYVQENLQCNPSVIFSSCNYTKRLAQMLNIPQYDVDIARKLVSLTSYQIRQKPLTYWDVLSDVAKPYFAKRIRFVGPQSVGKSTLVQYLAKKFQTNFVCEYGRIYTDKKPDLQVCDYIQIAKGKRNLDAQKILTSNKFLFCDTDCLSTKVYLQIEFPNQAHTLEQFFQKIIAEQSKTFQKTILVSPKGDGVEDGSRKYNLMRQKHFNMIKESLETHEIPYILLDGSYEQNTKRAVKIVKSILQKY